MNPYEAKREVVYKTPTSQDAKTICVQGTSNIININMNNLVPNVTQYSEQVRFQIRYASFPNAIDNFFF